MPAFPPLAISDVAAACVDDVATVAGRITVGLDDGRRLQTCHADLLAAVADLAQRRCVLDEGCGLLLDPLTGPADPELVMLQLRLGMSGEEIGCRHTTSTALITALGGAWEQVRHYATRIGDQPLLDELLIPHAEHYWPPTPA